MTAPVAVSTLATARVIAPIKAQIAGPRCSALGLTGTGAAPCLALCRALLKHGIPPDTPLEIYRGRVLALRIRSVGDGAQLVVRDNKYGTPRFRKADVGAVSAPPIAQTVDPFPLQPSTEINAPVSHTPRARSGGPP